MKRLAKPVFFLLLLAAAYYATWHVRHGDIYFVADIARDFLLLDELHVKKLILLGPRSSVPGLFHGPLWLYLSYPGYLLGNGSPVVMGWWWVALSAVFVWSCYFIGKKLFGQLTGVLYALMSSVYVAYIANGLYNPHGAMFLLPAFYFFFVRYIQTKNIRYLIVHVLLAGGLIQFQMAIGVPFTLLSFLFMLVWSIKTKKAKHLLAYALILIPLSTFILYDLKYGFALTKAAIRHSQSADQAQTMMYFVADRLRIAISGVEFLRAGLPNGSLYMGIIFILFLAAQVRDNKNRLMYLTFIYFYIGFYVLSLVNRYALLYFYVFPLFPWVFLFFCSFAASRYKKLFLVIFSIVYITNLAGLDHQTKVSESFIGKAQDSWKLLSTVANTVYGDGEKEFGYFVYAPDILGYGPKYAMSYTAKLHPSATAYSFQKKPITYLTIEPPPSGNPHMKDDWWKQNQIHIAGTPVHVVSFPNGYKVEKYALTEEEMNVPFDPAINPGIHFR